MRLQVFNNIQCNDNYVAKKYLSYETYANMFLNFLLQIVNIDEFEKKLNIFTDSAKAITLTQGISGIAKHGEDFVLVFNIAPTSESGKGMFNTSLKMLSCNGSYFHNGELYTKQFKVNKDIVLWYNDAQAMPEFTITQLANFLAENDTSLLLNIFGSRDNKIFACENESEKKQYEKALQEVRNGKHGIIVKPEENDPYKQDKEDKGIDITNPDNASKIQYLSHLYDDMMKRYGNMYGCCTSQTSKQAQQSIEEVQGMASISWLRPVQMLKYAQKFCEDLKEVFGIELKANFGIIHEMNFHKFTQECTKNDNDNNIETETLEKEGEKDDASNNQRDMDTSEKE